MKKIKKRFNEFKATKKHYQSFYKIWLYRDKKHFNLTMYKKTNLQYIADQKISINLKGKTLQVIKQEFKNQLEQKNNIKTNNKLFKKLWPEIKNGYNEIKKELKINYLNKADVG